MTEDQITRERAAYARGMEAAAKIADDYADVNLEMAGDTILADPALRPGPKDWAKTKELMTQGCIHSSMHHAAKNIAGAIRAASPKPGETM